MLRFVWQRQRQRQVLPLFRCISFHSFLKSEWKEVVNRRSHKHDKRSRGRKALPGQRLAEWQCARCHTRNFLSKSACRSCGKEKELQKDSHVDEKGQIAPLPRQGGGGVASGVAARPAGAAKGPAQLLAQTRLQLTQAREQGHPEDYIRILECKALKEDAEMRQAQPMGQRMDQARERFRGAVEAGEKAQEAMLKAQANFEQAQQEVVQTHMDLHKLMHEASLPVMPAPQVNVNLVKSFQTFRSFDRTFRKHVESRGKTTTRPTDSRNPRVEDILQPSSAILSQEGGAAMLWDLDEGEAEEMAEFEEAHAPSGAEAATQGRAQCAPQQKKTRTTGLVALAKGCATFSQVQLLTTRVMQNRKDTELDTLSPRTCALIPALETLADLLWLDMRVSGRGTVDHTGLTQRTRAKSDAGALWWDARRKGSSGATKCAEPANPPSHPKKNGYTCTKCQSVLGGVWASCCEHALLPSDRGCVAWEQSKFLLRGAWRQRGLRHASWVAERLAGDWRPDGRGPRW